MDDELYRAIKAKAAQSGRPVAELIEDAVRKSLSHSTREVSKVAPLPTFGGSGTLPGVDLTSGASLLDTMDEDVAVVARR